MEFFFFCKYYNQRKHSLAILHCQAVLLLVESDIVGLNFCHPTMARSKPNGLELSFILWIGLLIMDQCDSTILSSDERARLRLSGSLSIFYCLLIWIHSVVVVVVCFVAIARMIWVAELSLVMILIYQLAHFFKIKPLIEDWLDFWQNSVQRTRNCSSHLVFKLEFRSQF